MDDRGHQAIAEMYEKIDRMEAAKASALKALHAAGTCCYGNVCARVTGEWKAERDMRCLIHDAVGALESA